MAYSYGNNRYVCRLFCQKQYLTYIEYSKWVYDWNQQPTGRWNNSWYDLNVRVVLATMAIGCGGSDLSDFLSLLDIPNCASFGNNAFNKIESCIGRNLRSCGIEAMEEALKEEVRLTNIANGVDHDEWLKIPINQRPQVLLTVSFDMGWQKRSSGNRYDSLSGHAFMIGARTKNIIQCNVSSKLCMTCYHAERLNKTPRTHHCPKNYYASSKAIEADTALTLCKTLYDSTQGSITIGFIVADDDSSMKAKLQHKTKTHKTGSLPDNIPQPAWLADPSHRCKSISRPIFALASQGRKETECTNVDALRIKKYYGYAVRMNRDKSLLELKKAVDNILLSICLMNTRVVIHHGANPGKSRF